MGNKHWLNGGWEQTTCIKMVLQGRLPLQKTLQLSETPPAPPSALQTEHRLSCFAAQFPRPNLWAAPPPPGLNNSQSPEMDGNNTWFCFDKDIVHVLQQYKD